MASCESPFTALPSCFCARSRSVLASTGISMRRSRKARHLDRYRGDLVIQILAEAAGLHLGLQIAIGGRDHPHVDVARLPAAHGADLALLQNPQELGLKDRGNFADPVEKNGAAIGALEKSGVFLDGAGKGAAPVAEQFAFKHLVRHGGASLHHERPVPAQAVVMKRARDKLLARAGLARDEHGDVVRRDPPHAVANRVHRAFGVAHDAVAGVVLRAAPRACEATIFSARFEDILSSTARSWFCRCSS